MKYRKIAWEKWADFNEEDDDIVPVDDMEDDDVEQEDGQYQLVPMVVRTPIGNYGPFESLLPSKMFDCWICHTNFTITEEDKNRLDLVEGIEVLKIMSRYRFFIGIGKMFSLRDVHPMVELALSIDKESVISKIISEISGKKRWAVGIYEDASCLTLTSESDDDETFDFDLRTMKESGAINIVTSEDI